MARTENDTWDLATSVGATATMVAAARAAASRQPNPIINDPYAAPLVCAAGVEFFARLARGDIEYSDLGSAWIADFFAVRAHFFDQFFPDAMAAGIQQAVIVGSGLDSRIYRLAWPAEAVVYEIDQPAVLEFKTSTLAEIGASPLAELRTVGTDLRQDWPAALREAGFDSSSPSAWMLEGLMIGYLPGDAQNRMLDDITALSAQGSRLVADHLPRGAQSIGALMEELAGAWRQYGLDADLSGLTYTHERNDADNYLQTHGWATTSRELSDLLQAAGVPAGDMDTSSNGQGAIRYLLAARTAR
ncbi:SAM-dependent methyltransferase [Mycobacterium intermedium]|uniref:S-adenosyl-L-methionine-dependent methyltransferase n=1 Tax=Mycobacterium intermedium TaxID=28445 RepID=A0A1E3SHS3_MYCIE|nr:SAM-dependent methyltransferase [Mycobacterium intermedium]MCV6963751.1 SAM-dependent methyltransferase [Mycobacterium intermedium]ODR01108.1 SAM-dependent methyltransferase [Mycobacterium intermedium]OPE49288.1 SAM-dependent methyltransferase [Mycobacterium intermedium]ORB10523.1 SAM-dependent methyltransferase [Mycobacterium intermedium]